MNSSQFGYFVCRIKSKGSLKRVTAFLSILTTFFLSSLLIPLALLAAPGDITTIAGGGVGDTGPAVSASLYLPRGIHVTASGVIYIADTLNHRVRKIDTNGIITTVAGNGRPGFSGDGGPATSASFNYPLGVAVDHAGNIFIADAHNHRVRKVNTNGIISTIIGGGAENAGNYCSLPAAEIGNIFPRDIFLDSSDRVHVNDGQLWRLETDGTLIKLSDPTCGYGSLAPGFLSGFFDASGAFIYASGNNIFRTTDMQSSTLFGAIPSVPAGAFTALSGDSLGNIYVSVPQSNIVYKLDPTGTSMVFAGTGAAGYSGDGGDAVSANISNPIDIFADASGNVYIADRFNHRIRKVDLNGMITTVGGTGEAGYAGDGLTATSERLNLPRGVFVDSSGNVYIADTSNHRVRKIDTAGTMATIAGNGTCDFSGDGGQASAAGLCYPSGIFVSSDGTIYIADSFNDRIRKIDQAGTITTIAGTEDTGYAGDGGPATLAVLNYPTGVIVDGFGNIFIADFGNNAIRKIDTSGIISTYANIISPRSIALDSSGVLYVATDYDGVNKVYPSGTVDLMPSCRDAVGVSVDSAGTLYMACQSDNIIGGATPGMESGLVAGTGDNGFSGDGGPASTAMLASPSSVFVDTSGALYIADSGNNRVRRIEPGSKIVPWVKIISPWPGLISRDKTPLLSYTVSYGTVVVKVDGVVVNKVSGNHLDPLADGQHTVRVEATYSNVTGFAEETYTVDTVAPIISIVSPQSGLSNNNHPLLIYSVNEAVAYSYVMLDGSQKWMVSGDSLGTLSEGQHSVVVSAQDYAWNIGTAVVNFTIDSMPPRVTISSPAAGITNNNTPLLSYTASNGTVVVMVDGIVVNKVSGNYLDPLADGPHVVRVEATNANGTGFTQRTFTVDTAAPAPIPDIMEDFETGDLDKLPWTTSGNGLWVVLSTVKHGGLYAAEAPRAIGDNQSASLEVIRNTVADNISFWYSVSSEANWDFLRFYVDGVQKGQWSGTVSWTQTSYPVSTGTHTFKWVYSKDGSASAGADTAWIDDIVFPMPAPPTVTITSPAAGATNNNTPLLAYTSSGGTIVVKIDNVAVSKVSGNTLDALTDGTHTVRVEATNENGTGFSERTFTVDTLPPAVGIDPVTTPTKTTNQTITGTRESNATVSVVVNTTATVGVVSYPSTTTWSCAISGMAQGNNTITVTATDAATNSATAGTSIFVDTVAPSVSITSPVAGLTNNKIPALNYTVSDGTVVVKVDGIVVNKVSGNTLDPLADGPHTVRVESTDSTANMGFAEVAFTVDATAPTVTITSPTVGTTADNQPFLTYIVSDGTVTVKVDGVIVNKVSGNRLYELSNGPHTVRIDSMDAAGNVGFGEVAFTVNAPIDRITEDFETGDLGKLPWITSGNGSWSVKSTVKHGGIYAAEAPVSIGDSQSASLEVSRTTAADTISFWYSVSSEANWDFLKFYVDGVQKGQWSGTVPWTKASYTVSAGTHTFKWVYSKDGSVSTGSDTAWIDDIVFPLPPPAPSVTITSPAAGFTNSNSPMLNYSVSGGTVVVKVDGVAINKVSGDTLDLLADGSHVVRVEATDVNGTGFSERTFTVDTLPPAVGIDPVTTPTKTTNQTIIGTRESNATVSVAVNTTATVGVVSYPSTTTWSCAISGMAEGINSITVTATDAATNNATAGSSIFVDTVAPSVSITSPVAGFTNNKTPVLNYTVSDGIVVVKIDGVVAPKVSGDTLDTLVDGSHTVRVESTDAAGNTGFAEVTFTIDTIAPIVTITSPAANITNNNRPLLTYSVSEGTVVVKVDGAVVSKVSGNTLASLSDNSHMVRVEAMDAAGNTGFAQVTFTVDTVPPSVTISPVTTPTNVSSQTISGNRESGAVITVTVNTSASIESLVYPTATTWSCTVSNLAAGSNAVTITATDTAGNPATAVASITFDAIAPMVSLTSPGSAPTNDNTPLLTYSVSDGSVVVKVDGVVVSKVSGNSLNTLPDGSHAVRVESTDAAGNTGFAQVTFIVDTAPPAISINPVTTPTNNSSQTITGTRESGISVSVTVNTLAAVGAVSYPSATTWRCTISNLVRGSNVITARAVDAAGNNATAKATITKK